MLSQKTQEVKRKRKKYTKEMLRYLRKFLCFQKNTRENDITQDSVLRY